MTAAVLCVLLAAWTYLASCFEGESYQNLFVNRIRSALFRPVTALQRAVPRLGESGAAGLLFALSLLVGAALLRFLSGAGGPAGAAAPGVPASPGGGSGLSPLLLLAGQFLALLGQLWLLRLLFVWRLGAADRSPVRTFLDTATWPGPLLRFPGAPAAVAAGAFLGAAFLLLAGAPAPLSAALRASGFALPVRLAWLAAASTLLLLRGVLFALCLLTWLRFLFPFFAGNPTDGRSAWFAAWIPLAADLADEALSDFDRAVLGDAPVSPAARTFLPLLAAFVCGWLHPLLAGLAV